MKLEPNSPRRQRCPWETCRCNNRLCLNLLEADQLELAGEED